MFTYPSKKAATFREGDYYLLNFPRFGGGELGWQLSPLGCRPFPLPTRERYHTREMVLCRDEPLVSQEGGDDIQADIFSPV